MNIWQADFYKYPLENQQNNEQWQLIICDQKGQIIYQVFCQQKSANSSWLITKLEPIIQQEKPHIIQVFRPQSLNLLTLVANQLGVKVQATRRTPQLKSILKQQVSESYYNFLKIDQPPPQAVPENLWGEKWQFVTFKGGDIIEFFKDRPIPIKDIPELLFPFKLGLASTTEIPGIIIYGSRTSMYLARWLGEIKPVSLNYIPTKINESGGLILEAGLVDRWILATFEDSEMAQAAQRYETQKQSSNGLHFLVVQPDDSGVTYSGFWLLREEEF
ncbi:MAG TPA: hypothetical protein DCF68_03630 [Cyanothece sp. UBA12306]|nr:hypothetical protein [Cyanothece sp. UBA12306]